MSSRPTEVRNLAKIVATGSRKDVEKILKSTKHDVNEVLQHGTSPFWPYSWTALLYACRNLNVDVIQLLLEKGADPNFCANGGFTAIMAILMSTTEKNKSTGLKCTEMLVEAGLSIPQVPKASRRSLLTQAVNKNAPTLFAYFLESGADPNERDEYGVTPLNFAVTKDVTSIVECLREHGANPFIQNVDGHSCMDIALDLNKVEMKEILIAWRKEHYKAHFSKNKEEFFKMLNKVNAGCPIYLRKPIGTSEKRPDPTPKCNGNQEGPEINNPVGPVVFHALSDEEIKKIETDASITFSRSAQENLPISKKNKSKKQRSGTEEGADFCVGGPVLLEDEANEFQGGPILTTCRRAEPQTPPMEQLENRNGLVDMDIEPLDISFEDFFSDESSLRDEISSGSPSLPSSPFDSSSEKSERVEISPMNHHVILFVGFILMTIVGRQLFKRFSTGNN